MSYRCDRPRLRQSIVLALGALTLGLGCTAPASTPALPPAASTPTEITMVDPRGQLLPVTAVTTLGGEEIFLEVATTPQQQQLGLMFREELPGDRGMLFPMGPPRPVSFWMRNVPVALDMVFVHQGQIVGILGDVPPCAADPCPTFGPGGQLVDHVIELRAGRATELGLSEGDAVVVRSLE
jgi:uncharacterized membrane protein (UPF0127 family)